MLDFLKGKLDFQKVAAVSKATGIQPKVISTLQTNNMRADRALERLSQPGMTWQDFGTVITDWQGIMQGGVPHEQQYADSRFPNWKQKVAEWNTYVTGKPQETVPQPLVTYMTGVISGLKDVDNQYLKINSDYVSKTLGPTIPGFNKPGGLRDTVRQGTDRFIKGGSGQAQSFSSVAEAEAANLPKGTRITIGGRPAVIE